MSIAKMNKVTIIGIKDKEEEILKKLMKQGFFQIEDMSHLVEDEEFKDIFHKEEKNEEIVKINQKLVKIEKAISNIRKYYKIKKSMFAEKEIYKELSEKVAESSYCDVEKVNKIAETMEENMAKMEELKKLKKELEPWINFSISADLKNINYIKIILGTIDLKYKTEQIELALNKEKVDYSINIINKDKAKIYVAVTTKSENVTTIKRILKQFNFDEKNIELENETVAEKIQKTQKEIYELEQQIKSDKEKIKPEQIKIFENLYDYYLLF